MILVNTVYLLLIILGVSLQSVVKKPYTERSGGGGTYFFNTLVGLSAMLFFLVSSRELRLEIAFLPYALGFALSYAMASVFSVLAIASGSLSLTSLFCSYSLLLPTFYGLIFLGDKVSLFFVPAILLLMVSLFLINKKGERAEISTKWVLYVVLATVGNGFCSVVQKMQQVAFSGDFKNEFMIVALAVFTLAMAVMTVIGERGKIAFYCQSGWYFAVLCGIMNGAVNFLVMILSALMPIALMFPIISAGGIVLTYILSRTIYKESLTSRQTVGFVLGIVAVILFNI